MAKNRSLYGVSAKTSPLEEMSQVCVCNSPHILLVAGVDRARSATGGGEYNATLEI